MRGTNTPEKGATGPQAGAGSVFKLAAFTENPAGGNPAGVWIGPDLPDPGAMQQIAADIGFSETAFVAPQSGPKRRVRYYSPEAEVPFCGHATIAAGVVLGRIDGPQLFLFDTVAGSIAVDVREVDGTLLSALTSVEPRQRAVPEGLEGEVLASLGWERSETDSTVGPVLAYAGAWHLVLGASTRERLEELHYDFDRLKRVMLAHDLTTVQLLWRESAHVFHARNPFPVGGVVEDPATGAAAAALGGYLRDAGLVAAPTAVTIHQGEAMGRPGLLTVEIPSTGGIVVTGRAVDLPT